MKTFTGKVTSVKMQGTVVVEVSRRTPHPLYKKLLKRSSKFKAVAVAGSVAVGDTVTIAETRPISKQVYFKVIETKTKVTTQSKSTKAKEATK
jgi:small subunit ribosomal protein S17